MTEGPIRAAVMADTHGVLRPEVERILETCDVIIHAGDFDNQLTYHKLSTDSPLYAVRGNNDRGWSGGLPLIKRFSLGGVKFIMAHERKDIPSALGDTQVVIYGHSHMYQQQEISGRLWLNPGSCGYKRFTLPLSLAVMTIEDGKYSVETIWLEKGYGTPGAAIAQRSKPKESRYEKQQKRYRQKQKERAGQAAGLQKAVSPEEESRDKKSELFLLARILRQKKAGSAPEWAAENLNADIGLVNAVYAVCDRLPEADARCIQEELCKKDNGLKRT
ncbi:metallophosphoesterase family protein [Lacrimispora sp. 210928-DFI.3.58]|uniref:metallophosphoesterase family protein n=1 Tax=Lacrimispora sp. 210928-DFI.3.58 TaxID=2883214 RepID=UPI0015B71C07|nr:metallophosphoesterase family protein [Lacrimispora sp. 210928-DFI.3.58]MCB7317333.1 metallophosphatase family protein [Lacrimispora sp. 210928-DFI.3.58]